MKRRILAILVVMSLVFTLALTGCSPADEPEEPAEEPGEEEPAEEPGEEEPAEEPEEMVFNWNVGADPKTIDPCLNGASDGGDVINQTFEGLTREKSGEVFPGIAESWEFSDDGTVVTFYLRESKWSDGSDLTAHDFVYSWKRGMDPETASEYSWIWPYTNIKGAAEAI